MPNAQQFDLQSFEKDVLENLTILQEQIDVDLIPNSLESAMPAKGTLSIDSLETASGWWSRFKIRTNNATDKHKYTAEEVSQRLAIVAKQADQIVEDKNIKDYLCPALRSVSDDTFEIAKIIVPILVSLSYAKTIVLPLDSLLFALIPLSIARMGIATLCAGSNKKESQ